MPRQSELIDAAHLYKPSVTQPEGPDMAFDHSDSGPVQPATDEPKSGFPQIPDELEKDLVQIFKLLSDETRLRILLALAREGELHVSAICGLMGQSQPAVSHHLALLRVAGLIEARRDGKHNFYSVRRTPFYRLIEALFESMSGGEKDEVRFEDFVLTHGT